jgi:hypothetical protein
MSSVVIAPPPTPPPVEPGSDAPATLTLTYYRQLAAYLSTVIDEMTAIIPRLVEDVLRGGSPTGHLNIPLIFLATAIYSVEEHEELQRIEKLDPARGRDTLQLIEAFRPMRDKILAFERALGNALNTRQSALSVEALNTYAVAQTLARDESNPALTGAVANMKRDLGRGGNGKRKKKAAPALTPLQTAGAAPQAPDLEP